MGLLTDQNAERVLCLLEETLCNMGLTVRTEAICQKDDSFSRAGGLCRIRNQTIVILDSGAGPKERCATLLDALRSMDVSNVFLPPIIRELLDDGETPGRAL